MGNNFKLNNVFNKYDLVIYLILLLISNFIIRYIIELNFSSLPYYFDQLQLHDENSKWYTYMLPSMAKLWGGTWSSLGIGVLPILKMAFGNTVSYLLLNFLFIISAYYLSWKAFNSKIITITVGIMTAFTTLNDHVYQNGSLVIIYIPYIFCFINLFSLQKLFENIKPKIMWWYLWGISLLLYLLSFEGWLDYYAVTILASLCCYYVLYKQNDFVRGFRLFKINSILTITCVVYVILKIKYGYASELGAEHDIIFNYGKRYIPLMIEDFISNFFTLFYTTIITYIPPLFSFSNSLIRYGSFTIISLQNGYDPSFSYMAAINALMLWRFYAGIYFSLFIYFFYHVIIKLFREFDRDCFYIFLFMLMILFGSPAHLLVKFRPFHIVPWLSYQSFIGQIGLILVTSYALGMLHKSQTNKKIIWLVTILVWGLVISCPFLKPPFYKVGMSYGDLNLKFNT